MEKMSLFRLTSRVLRRARVPRAVAAIGAAGLGLAAVASLPAMPAHAQCDGMRMMPDGNWEFDPALCPRGAQALSVPQIWVAIAMSKATLGSATAWQAPSRSAAEKRAVDQCNKDKKTTDCSVAISGANICVALAISLNRAWAVGQDLSYIGADHVALSNCTANGGTNCFVTADPCSDDGPVK
jgi:hypothetical protein